MRIDILTVFPDMMNAYLKESIIGRALENGKLEVVTHNIRDYSEDKHKKTDDIPYGGGMGMIMLAQPIASCHEKICTQIACKPHFIYMSPQGKTLTQKRAAELSEMSNIAVLCGHYEGVDQRVLDTLCDEEISIGDYVLTGGELPALVLVDCIARMLDGVLKSPQCYIEESHFSGLLEHPQYTRPACWNDINVPPTLLSGNHAKIEKFRRMESLRVTMEKRPDLLKTAELSDTDKKYIELITRK